MEMLQNVLEKKLLVTPSSDIMGNYTLLIF